MAKSIEFVDNVNAVVTVDAGPAVGKYPTDIHAIARGQRDGILDLGWHTIGGKKMHLKTKLAEITGIEQVAARRAAHELELATAVCQCDRCGKSIARSDAAFQSRQIAGTVVSLPICPVCVAAQRNFSH